MLIIGRKAKQGFYIKDEEIFVNILSIKGNIVRVGIEAPRDIAIYRNEIFHLQNLN